MSTPPDMATSTFFFSLIVIAPNKTCKMWKGYHRSTRANTPDSVSFRRFLLFSSWLAPASLQRNVARQHRREYADSASLRLKKQKSLENTSLPGAGSFAGAEMCPGKERPAENTAVLSRDLTRYGRISARQNRVCPCQSMVVSPLYLISRGKATGKNRELFLCIPPLFVGFAGA